MFQLLQLHVHQNRLIVYSHKVKVSCFIFTDLGFILHTERHFCALTGSGLSYLILITCIFIALVLKEKCLSELLLFKYVDTIGMACVRVIILFRLTPLFVSHTRLLLLSPPREPFISELLTVLI